MAHFMRAEPDMTRNETHFWKDKVFPSCASATKNSQATHLASLL
jgi:hypothetical protein